MADKFIELYATGRHSIQDICDALQINRDTYYDWRDKKQPFAKRLAVARKNRLEAIGELGESALVLLLTKHEYEETTVEYTEGKDGKPKIKSQKKVKKFIMPNPSMVALTVTNRLAEDWKNKQDIKLDGEIKNITVRIE